MQKKTSPIEILLYIAIFLGGLYFSLHLGYAVHHTLVPGEQIELTKVINTLSATIEKQPTVFLKDFAFDNAIGKLVVFYIICSLFAIAWFTLDKKKYMKGKEHGSAEWATLKDTKKYIDPKDKNNNIILSKEVQMSINTHFTRRNLNVLVMGGSGAGKTRGYVKPNLMQANTNYVITDPKGEVLKSTGKMLKQQGYEIKVFNLIHMENSHNYNPFRYIKSDEDIMKLIDALIKNTNGGQKSGDPFWEKAETALLMAIMSFLWHEGDEEEQNFGMVMELLRQAEVKEDDENHESPLDIVFKDLKNVDPEHIAVRYYTTFKQASGKTAKSILISAGVRLGAFNLDKVQRLVSGDSIDIPSLADKKTALFVIIPDKDSTFNFLVMMLYTQIFGILYNLADFEYDGRLPYHVRFMLDEFANIGTIPDFEKLIATMRSREISANPIIQNMAQLKTMYKDSWESIVGNCDSFVFLGGMERTSLEYVSKGLGKMTIDTLNRSVSRGKSNSTSRNEGILGRDLKSSDEIGKMPNEDCILFIRGTNPYYNKKFDITMHNRYKQLSDYDKENIYPYTDVKTLDHSNVYEDETLEDDVLQREIPQLVEELTVSETDEYVIDLEEHETKEQEKELEEEVEVISKQEELIVEQKAPEMTAIDKGEDELIEDIEIEEVEEGLDPSEILAYVGIELEEVEANETDEYVYEYENTEGA